MSTVSSIAAFVFEQGPIAEALLFPEDEEAPVMGIKADEQEAIRRVQPHLTEQRLGILCACRDALLKRAGGHKLRKTLGRKPNRDTTIAESEEVEMPMVLSGNAKRATCGFILDVAEGDDAYTLRAWAWTQATYRQAARDAVEGLASADDIKWNGWVHSVSLGTPSEGESFEALGRRAAEELWVFAAPIASAVRAQMKRK